MASSNTEQLRNTPLIVANEDGPALATIMYPELLMANPLTAAPMHPELLMAASSGDCQRLKDLLNKEDAVEHQVVLDVDKCTAATMSPLEGVTFEGDSALHVVATGGESEEFLDSVKVIYDKARHLLDAPNKNGDTPLHCASRAGNVGMVSCLIELARREDGGDKRVKTVLRKQNKQGETALHEAVRFDNKDMVRELMSADSELARVPLTDGTSPLYLAISLHHYHIAQQLCQKDKELSYSGPDGQNALHAAILRSNGMTKDLLRMNKDLIKRGDKVSRSTPLHFVASRGKLDMIKLLLEKDKSSAYQSDNNGWFPIHVAASTCQTKAIHILVEMCPDCTRLRDADGRTFLHVAVKNNSFDVVQLACNNKPMFASILNIQDNEGNTALHLSVQFGRLWISHRLVQNKQVLLNLPNNKGQTPRDLASMLRPSGVYYSLHPRITIFRILTNAKADNGNHRLDHYNEKYVPKLIEAEEAKKISESTQVVGIGSVLVATVALAASFSIPGGFRADDHPNGGAPTLARHYSFDAFIISNALAFSCSGLAIICLMYSGITTVDIRTRMNFFLFSLILMANSARSLAAAFAFGIYATLTPVAPTTAAAAFAFASLSFLDIIWRCYLRFSEAKTLLNRMGIKVLCPLGTGILIGILVEFWSYVVIFGVVEYLKIHRGH